MKDISELFYKNNIEFFSQLSIEDMKIINRSLFERKTPFAKSAYIFLIPYFIGELPDRNISRYALARDYHLFISEVTDNIISELKMIYPDNNFVGMGDHSPIAEVYAAARAGLGVIGENGCLINKKYGSYVFIAEIFSDLEGDFVSNDVEYCIKCSLCKKVCPSPCHCLSDLTQQKGELAKETEELMRRHNTAWGCDICQEACPMNRDIEKTPIPFFYNNIIPALTHDILAKMSDEELSIRAYGWRKRKTVERNINILSDK